MSARKRQKEIEDARKPSSESGSQSGSRAMSPRSKAISTDLAKVVIPTTVKMRFPDKNIITEMEFLVAPDDGIWKGGCFLFHASFPNDYPLKPPKVKCLTKIYHPNIDYEGNVCLSILREEYLPSVTLDAIICGLSYLFYEPNTSDPLNREAADVLSRDPAEFKRKVAQSYRGGYMDGQTYERQPISYSK